MPFPPFMTMHDLHMTPKDYAHILHAGWSGASNPVSKQASQRASKRQPAPASQHPSNPADEAEDPETSEPTSQPASQPASHPSRQPARLPGSQAAREPASQPPTQPASYLAGRLQRDAWRVTGWMGGWPLQNHDAWSMAMADPRSAVTCGGARSAVQGFQD